MHKTLLIVHIFMFGVVCATYSPAYADDRANLTKFIGDPAEQQRVLDAAKHSIVIIQNPCASMAFKLLDNIAIAKPPAFDSSGKLTDGAWKQVVSAKGCGQNRTLNVFLWVNPNTKALAVTTMLPGTTHADMTLQKDATPHAFMASGDPEKGCGTRYIADTEFLKHLGSETGGAKGLPWDELWTVITCSKKAQVTMHFIPYNRGTTITATLQETKFF